MPSLPPCAGLGPVTGWLEVKPRAPSREGAGKPQADGPAQPAPDGQPAGPLLQADASAPPSAASPVDPRNHSYGQILKSSALIGASSVVYLAFAAVRNKVISLVLGPAGIGLVGVYTAIAEVAKSVAGMGLSNSGVRQIAEAVASGDRPRVAQTIITLRRVALVLAALGVLLLVALSGPVARFSFGDRSQAHSVALLSLVVFFGAMSGAQCAVIQGMRRIGDLARTTILGSVCGTVLSIPLVLLLGARGVVPFLVTVAGVGVGISWWYARRVQVERVVLGWRQVANEARALLQLGLVFMITGLTEMSVAYLVRVIILRHAGVEAAGFYQAAWTLAGLYAGFILQAMTADFYPRLTATAHDHAACNRLVNEQAEIALLLAGPGILITLTLAPWVIHLFYSGRFGPAIELLRWNCLGMLLRVASWPMSFILLAKGARATFLVTELLANLLYLGLVWFYLVGFGLVGVGMAFLGLYLFYWLLVFGVVRRLTGFRWSRANRRIGSVLGPLVGLTFLGTHWLSAAAAAPFGLAVSVVGTLLSLQTVSGLVPLDRLPRPAQMLLARLHLSPPSRHV